MWLNGWFLIRPFSYALPYISTHIKVAVCINNTKRINVEKSDHKIVPIMLLQLLMLAECVCKIINKGDKAHKGLFARHLRAVFN